MSQKLRMRPLGCGWISRRFGFAGVAFYASVMFAALSLGHSMASAQSDATDPPQEGREIIAAPDSVAAGQRLFGLNCTYCHGAKGIGGRGRPLQCRDDLTASIIFETITDGRELTGVCHAVLEGFDRRARPLEARRLHTFASEFAKL